MNQISDDDLANLRATYRRVRKLVYEEATRPNAECAYQHEANKAAMARQISALSNGASLPQIQQMARDAARDQIWYHLWSKIRYAGIKAAIASAEINSIIHVFNDLGGFSSADWDVAPSKGRNIEPEASGPMVRHFYERSGPFQNGFTIRNPLKLRKTIEVARKFAHFLETNRERSPLDFVTGLHHQDAVWDIQSNLNATGYRGGLTQLHAMMDMGFRVIKPDIVVSRLFLDWGWLHKAIPTLPTNLTRADLEGKGQYGRKYVYTKPKMYRPIIGLARQIVDGLVSRELERDIGWVTSNPLREFDIFLVKFGQKPEAGWGIERRLADSVEIVQGVYWKTDDSVVVASACTTGPSAP